MVYSEPSSPGLFCQKNKTMLLFFSFKNAATFEEVAPYVGAQPLMTSTCDENKFLFVVYGYPVILLFI